VYVTSAAAGTRNVLLWNSSGALLQSVPVNFPAGSGTVTLNIHLTPGTGYQIGGTSMNLYRNNSGPSYPYSMPGTINITGSSAGSGYYYYFYNWQVQNDPCVSARTPVVAAIGGPAVTYASATDTLCESASTVVLSGGSPAGGTYSGPGVSAGAFDPAASGSGTQTITYSYTDGNGCADAATQDIYVDACTTTGIASYENAGSFSVYPNPATTALTLEMNSAGNEKAEIRLLNAMGQLVLSEQRTLQSGNTKMELRLDGISSGVYMLCVRTGEGIMTTRITKN
jgi:hypothetical protein